MGKTIQGPNSRRGHSKLGMQNICFYFSFFFYTVCDLNCYKLPPYKWQKMCLVHSTPGLSFKVQLIYSIKVTVAMSSQGNSFRL